MLERPTGGQRAVIVGLAIGSKRVDAGLAELEALVASAGATVVGRVTGRRPAPDPALYAGRGKVDEISHLREEAKADLVIFDHVLSGVQQRNLEQALACRVVDRTSLILDIFAQRARSAEGKLQVELAQLAHLSTRLVRGWTHLERQKGGIGLRGPGETQLETDRRLIARRVKLLKERLSRVAVSRGVQSRTRKRARVRTVALVGYTNAGKSTLFNRLTRERVYAADQLFATLDTTLRRVHVPGADPVVLSDTVGFIRDLPHDLVAAFRATLSEAAEADLVVHVVDASAPDRDAQVQAVERVLAEIGADQVPQLTVLNKIDAANLVPGVERDAYGTIRTVRVSALTGEGCAALVSALAERFPAGPARADDAAAVGSMP
ncbi:MAG: GTPase HflX [Betaproteobacteria bacterium]|nr:GTPase HflX [Betaproteobacteria bacterium]